eukprot:scaffold3849_cov75-Phaeocystis_antarctica.AAC.1
MQILSAAVDAADVDQACRVALCWFSPAHGTACAGASGTWNALAARLFAQAPVLVPNDPRANFYALCNRVAEYRSGERTAPVATDRNVRAFVLAAAYWNAADKKVTDLWRKQDTKTDTAETMPGTHNLAGANEDSPTSVVPRPESAAVMRLKQMASMASQLPRPPQLRSMLTCTLCEMSPLTQGTTVNPPSPPHGCAELSLSRLSWQMVQV